MTAKEYSTSGIGDPYFYEWSIGQNYLLEMLGNQNIEKVILQTSEKSLEGVDDVIVKYKDSSNIYIQVKNTRIEDNLIFSYLFPNNLIKKFAEIYKENKLSNSKIVLSTNRKISENTTKKSISLKDFISCLDKALKRNKSIKNIDAYFIQNNTKNLNDKWNELKNELLSILKTEEKVFEFLSNFELKEEVGLKELKEVLLKKISKIFTVDMKFAGIILAKLDSKLREWVTTSRDKEEITREDVLSAISKLDLEIGDHFIEPPADFLKVEMKP